VVVHERYALSNFVLGHVPDHVVLRETERAVIGCADALEDWACRVVVLEEVVGHRVAWLDHAHDFSESLRRGVDLRSYLERRFRRQTEFTNKVRHGDEGLVDDEICIFRVLDKPLVWEGVAAKYELEPIPFERIAHGPVDGVDGRERADDRKKGSVTNDSHLSLKIISRRLP